MKTIEDDIVKVLNNVTLSEFEDKEILITGASGLIGTWILHALKGFVEQGHNIRRVTIVSKTALPKHLSWIFDTSWIQIVSGDLTDISFLQALPVSDYILHAAGYGQPSRFAEYPELTIKLNTISLFYLMDKLRQGGKFLFTSSSAVYTGLSGEHSFLETEIGNTNTDHPRACYIEGKRCGEAICLARRNLGQDIKVARLSIVYGPGTKSGDVRAMNRFVQMGLQEQTIQLLDGGEAVKTYLYVADAVQMLFNIWLHGKQSIYNVGGHERITVATLANKIGHATNTNVAFGNQENFLGALLLEEVNTNKYNCEFGLSAVTSLDEGIQKTIMWQREWIYNAE